MAGNVKLDRIDINILSTLQTDGKMTNITLAEAVGLSPSPCLQRVKRLEKAGFIESYRARINLGKLMDHILVFTEVTLSDHRREDFIRFEREIKDHEYLQSCHLISGGYDYLLKFVARTVAHYQEIMEGILARNIGVEKYFSYIVIKTLVDGAPLPVKSLLTQQQAD